MAKEHVASNMEVLERAKKKVQSRVSDKLYNSIFLVIKILFLERGGGAICVKNILLYYLLMYTVSLYRSKSV